MNMNRTIRVDPRKGADRETPTLNFAGVQKEVESLLVIHSATLEDKISCVGRGIKLLKELKEIAYFKKDKREDALKLAKDVLIHLSSFGLTSDDERSKSLVRILDHYRVSLLGDDNALADWFDRARLEYSKDPENQGVSINFGWILHDCIKTAMRLCNAKLIRYFLDEFERWEYKGGINESVERLMNCRKRDIKAAKVFLSGPIDAIIYKDKSDWCNALRAAEAFLKRNPRNEIAYNIAIDACLEVKNYSKMIELCVEAIKSIPSNIGFQYRFIRVVWSMYKDLRNANYDVLHQQRVLGLSALLHIMDKVLPLLEGISPKTKDYSSMLSAATKICISVCATSLENASDICSHREYASLNYISFVKKWNLDNLTEDDKVDRFVNGRRYSSLSANVVLALLKCVANANSNTIISANPWIMEFVSNKEKLFSFGRSDYFLGMANAWFRLGDMESSRSYAKKLLWDDQSDDWRWRVLARTYPKESQERNDCLKHAKSFKQCMADARFSRMANAWFDGLKFSDEEIVSTINERVQEKSIQDSRAEALLIEDATRYKGVILTRFDRSRKISALGELMDDKTSLRIWWRDKNGVAKTDFVSFSAFEDIDSMPVGTPVWVLVVSDGGYEKVVKVLLRTNAKMFDVYSYRVGVVVDRNESRHTFSVMYDEGMCCQVNIKRIPSNDAFRLGALCRIAILEREGIAPLFLDIKEAEDDDIMPSFVKDFEGVLTRKPGFRDANVGEIVVSSGAYSREMIDRKVSGTAALFSTKTGARIWRAVTISTILKNLEVRP